jgi:DNA-binding transcriptional MerR regulator
VNDDVDPAGPWAIGQVATRVGLEADTLRYYERRGILPAPSRGPAGRRVYDESAVHLIEVLLHLRATGMPLAQIAEFTRLVAADPEGVRERLELLQDHHAAVALKMATWRSSMDVIESKIRDYEHRLQG